MSRAFHFPQWVPCVTHGSKVLVVGASGGIGQALIRLLLKGPASTVGIHRSSAGSSSHPNDGKHVLIDLQSTLITDEDCRKLVTEFTERAGGIDALVALCGGIAKNDHWRNLSEKEWKDDIDLNLNIPFLLSRAAMKLMEDQGGRIVLMGTESALHGGSPTSFAYGVAKRGIECLVQGLALEGAKYNILVNAVRPGFIRSGFHERWQDKTEDELIKRAEYVPVKRAGEPEEVAALIIYLLSEWSGFITGQIFAITGGDWL